MANKRSKPASTAGSKTVKATNATNASLVKELRDAIGKIINAPQQLAFGGNSNLSYSRRTPTNEQLLLEYQTNAVVYTCADINAKSVAMADCGLFAIKSSPTSTTKYRGIQVDYLEQKRIKKVRRISKQSSLEEVTDHPFLQFINSSKGFQLLYLTSTYFDILGAAYWYAEREGDDLSKATAGSGEPTDFHILMPQSLKINLDDSGRVTGYEYKVANRPKQLLAPESVIDFRMPSLSNPYYGAHSALSSCYPEALLLGQMSEHMNTLLMNRGRPDAILMPKDDIGPGLEEAKRAEAKYNNKFKGAGSGRIMVGDGKYTYQPLSFPPTDLAVVEFSKRTLIVVSNAFGVPEEFFDKNANRSSAETALYRHAKLSTAPRLSYIEDRINETIVPMYGDDKLVVCFENVVPEDKELELKAMGTIPGAVDSVTVNEYRAKIGLCPLPDGDARYATPTTAAAMGVDATSAEDQSELGAEAAEESVPEEALEQEFAPNDDKALDLSGLITLNEKVFEGRLSRAIAINIAESYGCADAKNLIGYPAEKPKPTEKAHKPNAEAKLTETVKALFSKQRSDVLGSISKGFDIDHLTKAADGGKLPDRFTSLADWDKDFAHKVKPVMEISANGSAKDSWGRVGASPDAFSVVPAKVSEAIDKAALNFAESTNRTTTLELNEALDNLRESIRQGLLEGDPIPELRKRVNEVFDNAETYRAERIAHTETSRAVHEGQRIASKESDLVSDFKLLVSDDACPVCLAVAESTPTVGLDGTFSDGSYDDSLLPIHPNCRCTAIEILKGDSDSSDNSDSDNSDNSQE